MSTRFQGSTTHPRSVGTGNFQIPCWWRTTGPSISIRSVVSGNPARGSSVTNWPSSITHAINSAFFPNDGNFNNLANAFSINNGARVLATRSDHLDGSQNWEDRPGGMPLDFMMMPLDTMAGQSVIVGTGGSFPIFCSNNGRGFNMSGIRWGTGGMDLELSNVRFNTMANFNNEFKWRHTGAGNTTTRANRVAISCTNPTSAHASFIVAVMLDCTVFDVRSWLRARGSLHGLLLDGGGSAQARAEGRTGVSSTRRIPVVLSM